MTGASDSIAYGVQRRGGETWIVQGEALVLRLKPVLAAPILAHAEALRMAGYLTHLNEFLAGVVAGDTYATMETIGAAVRAPDAHGSSPRKGG